MPRQISCARLVCRVVLCVVPFVWLIAPALAQTVEVTQPERPTRPEDVFVRMFPGLPAFAPPTNEVREQLKKFGQKGGALDAKDLLTDPVQSILDPSGHSPHNPDNPAMTAGMTFLGQFIDHDLTFDLKSALQHKTEPRETTNFRTAAFDLDSLYGSGPRESARLYDTSSGYIKMRVDAIPGSEAVSRKGAARFDLPRDAGLQAVLGDSRNDENVIISQLHVAMLRFHNAVTDHLVGQPSFSTLSPAEIFERAQRLVRWHYQWIVLSEFLPATIGQERVDDILRRGARFYNLDDPATAGHLRNSRRNPMIPIEFSVAAYRFGHSQVRPSYRLNFGPDGGSPVFVFAFDDTADPNDPDPNDMRGGKRAPRRYVDWQTFFDFGDGNVRPNKMIDGKLSSVLMDLPGSRGASPGLPPDGIQSLASRNLMRHVNFGLPSGQAIARVMGAPVLSPEQLADIQPFGFERSTPLWFYILKEAEVLEGGRRLGPVGSRIVGEVMISLLKADQSSFLAREPNWRPTLPSSTPGQFRMRDLLTFAGVVPPL